MIVYNKMTTNDLLLELEKCILVHCSEMDKSRIYYKCPYCFTVGKSKRIQGNPFKKNGDRYVSATPTIHYHGNKNYKLGTYDKVSHCTINKKPVQIVVDSNTRRIK